LLKRLSIKDFLLFAEAWALIALARFMLVFVSFQKILPLLGERVTNQEKADEGKNEFKYIRIAIARACKYSFWRTKCFEQALCAKLMLRLRKHPSTIYFGVKRDTANKEFMAHAWLICNNEIITGGSQTEQFQILSSFYK